MKMAFHLLFLVIVSTMLTCEPPYSATTDEAKQHQNVSAALQKPEHDRAAKKIHPHGSASLAKPNPLQGHGLNQKRVASTTPPGPQRTASIRSTRPENGVPAVNRGVSKTHLAPPAGTSRTSIATSVNVRHHGPNPATLGGSASVRAANAGSLSGTRMGRKP